MIEKLCASHMKFFEVFAYLLSHRLILVFTSLSRLGLLAGWPVWEWYSLFHSLAFLEKTFVYFKEIIKKKHVELALMCHCPFLFLLIGHDFKGDDISF